jgi:hypothetical protein
MLGRRWSLARGVNKTERVQLIDGLGHAGTYALRDMAKPVYSLSQ